MSIFKDKKGLPAGFALGSVEGRVAIQYINPSSPRENFTFKCHRSNGTPNGFQEIYAVSIRMVLVIGGNSFMSIIEKLLEDNLVYVILNSVDNFSL